MKKLKWIIVLIIFLGIGLGAWKVYDYIKAKKEEERTAWKVEITNEYINVRSEPNTTSSLVGKVYEGEVYRVVDMNRDDTNYIWFQIKLKTGGKGWISSTRKNPYVIEINSPNKEEDTEKEIEYIKPQVLFFEDEYHVATINDITYDHLVINEDSEYTIKHIVYYEPNPKKPIIPGQPQYWIQYIVEDEFGNTTRKVQRIVFDVNPKDSEVTDFSKLKR